MPMNQSVFTKSFSLVVIPALVFGSSAFAQDRGRMPDGRAYRVDGAGNQLVDYIAELEVSTEALNRRVMGLEDEVAAKNRLIEQMRAGGGANIKPLSENDLLRGKGESAKNSAASCPVNDCTAQIKAQVDPLKMELQRVQSNLDDERQQAQNSFVDYENSLKELRVKVDNPNCPRVDCSADIARTSAALEEAQSALESERAERIGITQKLTSQVNELQEQLSSTQGDLVKVRGQYNSAKERAIAAAEAAKKAEQMKAPELVAVNSMANSDARASYRGPRSNEIDDQTAAEILPPSNPNMPASLVAARERAVLGLRSGLMQDLSETSNLITKRDRQFAKFKQPAGAVKIKPSSAVAASGRDLDSIAKDAKMAKSVYELSQLRKDLADIRAKTQDDIAIMNRMSAKR